jgi:SSS family solute:Na+ symporter
MIHGADEAVLIAYLATIVVAGWWLGRRTSDADDFMAAGRSLPGWAVGLSMFGTYVSSLSFLGNTGKAYAGNWNALAFTLAAPLAAPIAVYWFVPFYRRSHMISAYEHLEHRFGAWARTYAVACYLLTQMARMGAIVYLLGLAVAPLLNWPVATTIIVTGGLMTFYTLTGGIKSAVWIGVLQSVILVAGVAVCVVAVINRTPGGVAAIIDVGAHDGKFSLGSFGASMKESTFWVIFIYGLVSHLTNLGVDQSFIQRYITARDDRAAARSVWITVVLYMPTATLFFFIGTGLYVFYDGGSAQLPEGVTGDKAFPHFIATQLPPGAAGLVVAALFAASMDSNLSSMATLTLCDLYQRYFRPAVGQRESLRVLQAATVGWGVAGTAVGLAMIGVGAALDAWWNLASLFSGGVLGLVLLGFVTRKADHVAGAFAVAIGVLVIVWMTLPQLVDVPQWLRNPFHVNMTIVVGTLAIFLVGLLVTQLRSLAVGRR